MMKMTTCHSSIGSVEKGCVKQADGWIVGEMDANLRCVYVLLIDTDLPLYFFKDGTRPSTGFLLEFLFVGHFHIEIYTSSTVVRLRHSLFKTPLLE